MYFCALQNNYSICIRNFCTLSLYKFTLQLQCILLHMYILLTIRILFRGYIYIYYTYIYIYTSFLSLASFEIWLYCYFFYFENFVFSKLLLYDTSINSHATYRIFSLFCKAAEVHVLTNTHMYNRIYYYYYYFNYSEIWHFWLTRIVIEFFDCCWGTTLMYTYIIEAIKITLTFYAFIFRIFSGGALIGFLISNS